MLRSDNSLQHANDSELLRESESGGSSDGT